VSVDINVECTGLFASKPAPTLEQRELTELCQASGLQLLALWRAAGTILCNQLPLRRAAGTILSQQRSQLEAGAIATGILFNRSVGMGGSACYGENDGGQKAGDVVHDVLPVSKGMGNG